MGPVSTDAVVCGLSKQISSISVKHRMLQYFQLGALFSLCTVKCLLSPAPIGSCSNACIVLRPLLGVVKLTVFKAL